MNGGSPGEPPSLAYKKIERNTLAQHQRETMMTTITMEKDTLDAVHTNESEIAVHWKERGVLRWMDSKSSGRRKKHGRGDLPSRVPGLLVRRRSLVQPLTRRHGARPAQIPRTPRRNRRAKTSHA